MKIIINDNCVCVRIGICD